MTDSKSIKEEVWNAVLGLVMLVPTIGIMFLAAAYLRPAVLGHPGRGGSFRGLDAAAEFAILMCGMLVGAAAGMALTRLVRRRWVDVATQARLRRRSLRFLSRSPRFIRAIAMKIEKPGRPP